MITIRSGKMVIPEDERFVGYEGDHLGNTVRFVLPELGDYNGRYSLCLRFDDDTVREIPLDKEMRGSNLYLIWNIRSEHLLKAGVVMAQVKYVDMEDVVRHSTCDFFVISDGADSADDNENEFVTRAENEEMMTAFLDRIRASAPFIGEDNRWYYYDAASDDYIGSERSVVTVDSEFIPNSSNPVQSCVVKDYVDTGLADKVDNTVRIAGIRLNSDIPAGDLVENLAGQINPRMVDPDETVGYGGQYGKTIDNKPVMCTLGSTWVGLATVPELEEKMALTPNVAFVEIPDLPDGQLFLCQGGIGVKTSSGYVEIAKSSSVYSKSEIDGMIGNVETLLSAI